MDESPNRTSGLRPGRVAAGESPYAGIPKTYNETWNIRQTWSKRMKQYKRVLVTTDFSNVNRAALLRARDVSKEYGSELILLHVIEHFPFDAGPLSSAIPPELKPEYPLLQGAQEKLGALAAELQLEKARREVTVTPRSAQREILRFAEAEGVDLIVVAPHEHGFLGNLGSTAMGVVSGAHCDVLTVREAG